MKQGKISRRSAPECQLSKLGTDETFSTLLRAARELSEKDLKALEEDIDFYSQTGLIGVRMSWMLAQIGPRKTIQAA